MIRYYYQPSTQKTYAELRNCRFDAINKIDKFMNGFDWCLSSKKYLMNDTYRVSVKLREGDVHDPVLARKYAKEKLMKRYYRDFDRCVSSFKSDILVLNGRIFETPEEVENNT